MEFFARLEADGFAGGYADFSTGTGIAANAGFTGADAEHAESAQFDALTRCESLFEALKDRIHRSFRFGPRQSRALDYLMDDVLLNQWGNLAGPT